jgi:hypothetical protein
MFTWSFTKINQLASIIVVSVTEAGHGRHEPFSLASTKKVLTLSEY